MGAKTDKLDHSMICVLATIYTYVTIRSRYARCQCFRCFGCFDCTRTEKHVQRTLMMGSASTLIYLIGSSVRAKRSRAGEERNYYKAHATTQKPATDTERLCMQTLFKSLASPQKKHTHTQTNSAVLQSSSV